MLTDDLDRLLRAAGQPPLLEGAAPDDALDRVEAAAEAAPADPALRAAFHALHRRVALASLPAVVAGVRREALVRWDAHTSTWTGVRVRDGAAVMVRFLDVDDPRLRRSLWREGRALGLDATREPALVVELRGEPLSPPRPGDPTLAGVLGTALQQLCDRADAGVPAPPLHPDELRREGDVAVVCCLSIGDAAEGAVGSVCGALAAEGDDGPLLDLVRGLAELPVSPAEAAQRLAGALGRELVAMRHHLVARWVATAQHTRVQRLSQLLERLQQAVPPPRGRAAAGVDMDGRVLLVCCDEDRVQFGIDPHLETVWSAAGLDAPLARRVLRAQAAAPPNPRLSRQVGGTDAFNDAIGRWLAASMRLRTLHKLLEASR